MSVNSKENNTVNTKFSVSICVYKNDNPEHFKEALESIINQTKKPDEIVLVVDGPITESLNEIILNYEDESFFKVIRLHKNVGHGNARRIGLENCSYELIALMDSDDISLSERFEKELRLIVNNKVDAVGGDIAEFMDDVNNIVAYRRVPKTDDEIKQYAKKRCPFNQMTVMFKKEIYDKAGGYIDWYCDEDYYLWLRMMLKSAVFANTGDVLVHVRVGNEMYQRRGGWKYFVSEKKLQKYMLEKKIIGVSTYLINCLKRYIVQVVMPNKIRGWVFQKFARVKTLDERTI